MKKILITGANSYIGTSFEKYITENFADDYIVDTIDMIGDTWREKSFTGYDSVFHVAGIAHQKETKENANLYYEVNRDLAIEIAKKAKNDGVKQFIFLSSMSVYGMDVGVITRETLPNPKSHYGRSKLQAEEGINTLSDDNFKVCTLRPPMVYGKGCKGNFNKIKKLVEKFPIFPYVKNERSMIYVDNLSSFIKMAVDNSLSGLFMPQNREYVSTIDLAMGIAEGVGKKIRREYLTGVIVKILRLFYPAAKKAFGSLIYENTEVNDYSYVVTDGKHSYIASV